MRILPLDATAIRRFRRLRKSHRRIGTNDLKIAATVVENSAILITRNVVDFQEIDGLVCEHWSQPM